MKQNNEQKSLLCRLTDKRRKLETQLKELKQSYNPDERIALDDVPGTEQIRELELEQERMKLKLNEARNTRESYNELVQELANEQLHYGNRTVAQKKMLDNALAEHQNTVKVRLASEEAEVVSNATHEYRAQEFE